MNRKELVTAVAAHTGLEARDVDKALKEAEALGLTSAPLKKFALEYIQSHNSTSPSTPTPRTPDP